MFVDEARLRADFDALARIGATPGGGVHRPALGPAHLEARRWFLERARDAGLDTSVDAAGNHSALLRRGDRTVLLGSHLDSVPDGGRYDGALGVVAALEVLRTVADARLDLPVTLEAIDFTDEEGTLVGLLGSLALAGALDDDALAAPRGGREELTAALAAAGLDEPRLRDARRDPTSLAGYVELHIEQGPSLDAAGAEIGLVTAIVGARSFRVAFDGVAAHAGTTPMAGRRDAAVAAAAFVTHVRGVVTAEFPGAVATVGSIELEPGAFNVIPGRAVVGLEFRASDAVTLDALETRLLAGVDARVEPVGRWEPTELSPRIRDAAREAATSLGLRAVELPSGAGHDAQALASVTDSGMIFVPSDGGLSHSPREHTPWERCVDGANVLLRTALALATAR
ncbi:MAG TPA: Zn-dependent hydrolase [Gaiellaceae bacterium]|nr:Zn-dependent hydrolase [Gaiellaceae bacterium]